MLRIGFMGLGIMGLPMARNIMRAGFPLIVYNRDPEKAAALVEDGALQAASPAALAKVCDVAVAMVTGPEALESLLFGVDGAAAELAGKVFVSMASVSPEFARSLAGRLEALGVRFVDAPVSGTKKPAEDGALVILAGGPEELVAELEPIFLAMGRKVIRCGEVGKGSMMKMSVNLLLGVMLEGLAEAVRFGEKGGLNPADVLGAVLAGPLACPLYQMKAPMLEQEMYPVSFPLEHMVKDLRFVLGTAAEVGAETPAARAALSMYERALERGLGREDFASVDLALSGRDPSQA